MVSCSESEDSESSVAAINDNVDEGDVVCAVCMDGDVEEGNEIVFCDTCDVAVHQFCYGVLELPPDSWHCKRCLSEFPQAVSCILCPFQDGAFKQTDDGRWAHLACAIWIPEMYFLDITLMEPIMGLANIDPKRFRMLCSLCKKQTGACIQCAGRSCQAAFHPLCALRKRLAMEMFEKNGGVHKRIYCRRHESSCLSSHQSAGESSLEQVPENALVFSANPNAICDVPMDQAAGALSAIPHAGRNRAKGGVRKAGRPSKQSEPAKKEKDDYESTVLNVDGSLTEEENLERIYSIYFAPTAKDLIALVDSLQVDPATSEDFQMPPFGTSNALVGCQQLAAELKTLAVDGGASQRTDLQYAFCGSTTPNVSLLDQDDGALAVVTHVGNTAVCELKFTPGSSVPASIDTVLTTSRAGSGVPTAMPMDCFGVAGGFGVADAHRHNHDPTSSAAADAAAGCVKVTGMQLCPNYSYEEDEITQQLQGLQAQLLQQVQTNAARHAQVKSALLAHMQEEARKAPFLALAQRLEQAYVKRQMFRNVIASLTRGTTDREPPRLMAHVVDDDDDTVCFVCFHGESEDSNPIVFCDKCDVAVHQVCYGIASIPEDDWYCRRCQFQEKFAACALCPIEGGAMKKTDDGRWAHPFCTWFVPEARFSDLISMEPITGVAAAVAARPGLVCSICHDPMGSCVYCDFEDCGVCFHPFCAWYEGYHMSVVDYWDPELQLHNPYFLAFCPAHSSFRPGSLIHQKAFRSKHKYEVGKKKVHKKSRSSGGNQSGLRIRAKELKEDHYAADTCCVCFEPETESSSIRCPGCAITMHTRCCGAFLEVDKSWQCDKCTAKVTAVQCALCPRKGGALQRTTDSRWVHVACALWLQGSNLHVKPSLEPFFIGAKIPQERWNAMCYLCKHNHGACVTCDAPGCPKVMHPLCARMNGCQLTIRFVENRHVMCSASCKKHSPLIKFEVPDGYLKLQELRADLEKVRLLCDISRRREKLKKQILRVHKAVILLRQRQARGEEPSESETPTATTTTNTTTATTTTTAATTTTTTAAHTASDTAQPSSASGPLPLSSSITAPSTGSSSSSTAAAAAPSATLLPPAATTPSLTAPLAPPPSTKLEEPSPATTTTLVDPSATATAPMDPSSASTTAPPLVSPSTTTTAPPKPEPQPAQQLLHLLAPATTTTPTLVTPALASPSSLDPSVSGTAAAPAAPPTTLTLGPAGPAGPATASVPLAPTTTAGGDSRSSSTSTPHAPSSGIDAAAAAAAPTLSDTRKRPREEEGEGEEVSSDPCAGATDASRKAPRNTAAAAAAATMPATPTTTPTPTAHTSRTAPTPTTPAPPSTAAAAGSTTTQARPTTTPTAAATTGSSTASTRTTPTPTTPTAAATGTRTTPTPTAAAAAATGTRTTPTPTAAAAAAAATGTRTTPTPTASASAASSSSISARLGKSPRLSPAVLSDGSLADKAMLKSALKASLQDLESKLSTLQSAGSPTTATATATAAAATRPKPTPAGTPPGSSHTAARAATASSAESTIEADGGGGGCSARAVSSGAAVGTSDTHRSGGGGGGGGRGDPVAGAAARDRRGGPGTECAVGKEGDSKEVTPAKPRPRGRPPRTPVAAVAEGEASPSRGDSKKDGKRSRDQSGSPQRAKRKARSDDATGTDDDSKDPKQPTMRTTAAHSSHQPTQGSAATPGSDSSSSNNVGSGDDKKKASPRGSDRRREADEGTKRAAELPTLGELHSPRAMRSAPAMPSPSQAPQRRRNR